MKAFLKRYWPAFAIIILSANFLLAGGDSTPHTFFASSGKPLVRVDTNGIINLANGSNTTAEGVNTGFVTGSATKEFQVTFKNSTGTAVTLADTRYAVFVSVEEATGVAGAAEPTAIITKTTSGFYIQTDNNLTSDHTLRWIIQKY